ncbi:MAG: hypothetical protein JWO36_4603 [Myxococcales bacterium]|nr:hypothetical protein [Myxococcales bacterium]
MADEDADLRVRSPFERATAWLGTTRDYQLTRFVILRLLGVVYVFAFLGIVLQGLPLLGSHGLTPIDSYVDRLHAAGATFWDVPSVFLWNASDGSIVGWAYVGLAISIAVALGYANLPMLLALWMIYGSYERVGQLWFGFGWEIQLLETTLIAAFLAHPWDPRPLAARPPPVAAVVLMRWLAFRIMLGAGLIKLRGSSCWTDLTCLDAHFETQPIPNPVSGLFHHMPHAVHATGVAFNHVVELVAPWFVFGPRKLRLIAGCAMVAFQIVLVASGNLAFLNWLTLVPLLACFDDDFLLAVTPRRVREWLRRRIASSVPRDGWQLAAAIAVALFVVVIWEPMFGSASARTQVFSAALLVAAIAAAVVIPNRLTARIGRTLDGHQLAVGCFAALVTLKSFAVIDNLAAKHQAMNRSYDRLAIVNTYGAFGSVDMVRHELVIEGSIDGEHWLAYELPCKPGALDRRPCLLGPYHLRLDWLIWFAAMSERPRDPWILHLVWKLLDGDTTVRQLIAVDPFGGKPPKWVRIRRFVYHLAPQAADAWWTRDDEQLWLPPITLDSPDLREALEQYGWPSPSQHD